VTKNTNQKAIAENRERNRCSVGAKARYAVALHMNLARLRHLPHQDQLADHDLFSAKQSSSFSHHEYGNGESAGQSARHRNG
jgi:hypothetical protein